MSDNHNDKSRRTYRICEHNGNFNIEVEVISYQFTGWKPKMVEEWCTTNEFGGVYRSDRLPFINQSPTFKNIADAEGLLKKWCSEPIYHYY